MKKLSNNKKKKIIKLYQDGYKVSEISRKIKLPYYRVQTIVKKKKLSDKKIDHILKLYESGIKVSEIAKEVKQPYK